VTTKNESFKTHKHSFFQILHATYRKMLHRQMEIKTTIQIKMVDPRTIDRVLMMMMTRRMTRRRRTRAVDLIEPVML
jgi:hypothetical protein